MPLNTALAGTPRKQRLSGTGFASAAPSYQVREKAGVGMGRIAANLGPKLLVGGRGGRAGRVYNMLDTNPSQ